MNLRGEWSGRNPGDASIFLFIFFSGGIAITFACADHRHVAISPDSARVMRNPSCPSHVSFPSQKGGPRDLGGPLVITRNRVPVCTGLAGSAPGPGCCQGRHFLALSSPGLSARQPATARVLGSAWVWSWTFQRRRQEVEITVTSTGRLENAEIIALAPRANPRASCAAWLWPRCHIGSFASDERGIREKRISKM